MYYVHDTFSTWKEGTDNILKVTYVLLPNADKSMQFICNPRFTYNVRSTDTMVFQVPLVNRLPHRRIVGWINSRLNENETPFHGQLEKYVR